MTPPGSAPMLGEKHRLRFEKSADLRLLSHLDLMRSVERLCRRAEIPFKFTQGFHPSPRIVLALALPLGVVGKNEVMEIELTEPLEAEVLLERMTQHTVSGLNFLSAYAIEPKVNAFVRRAIYRLALTESDYAIAKETVPALLAQEKVWAARRKPRPRQINIRPYLRELIVERNPTSEVGLGTSEVTSPAASPSGDFRSPQADFGSLRVSTSEVGLGTSEVTSPAASSSGDFRSPQADFGSLRVSTSEVGLGTSEVTSRTASPSGDFRSPQADFGSLTMDLWVTPYGTARSDELIDLLGLPSPYDTGALIERIDLELHDETYSGLPDSPPEDQPELKPLDISPDAWSGEPKPAAATWGLSPNGPVVE